MQMEMPERGPTYLLQHLLDPMAETTIIADFLY